MAWRNQNVWTISDTPYRVQQHKYICSSRVRVTMRNLPFADLSSPIDATYSTITKNGSKIRQSINLVFFKAVDQLISRLRSCKKFRRVLSSRVTWSYLSQVVVWHKWLDITLGIKESKVQTQVDSANWSAFHNSRTLKFAGGRMINEGLKMWIRGLWCSKIVTSPGRVEHVGSDFLHHVLRFIQSWLFQ